MLVFSISLFPHSFFFILGPFLSYQIILSCSLSSFLLPLPPRCFDFFFFQFIFLSSLSFFRQTFRIFSFITLYPNCFKSSCKFDQHRRFCRLRLAQTLPKDTSSLQIHIFLTRFLYLSRYTNTLSSALPYIVFLSIYYGRKKSS